MLYRRFISAVIAASLILLTGCAQTAAAGSGSTDSNVIYITATPAHPTYIVVTSTPDSANVEAAATSTQEVASTITISSATDEGNGVVAVNWSAVGSFPNGYQVVWSATNQQPTFPLDSSTYVSDAKANSVQFQGQTGTVYYVRVCRYANLTCDLYSNVAMVGLYTPTATATATATVTPYTYYDDSVAVSSSTPYIRIYSIRGTGFGAATIYWKAYGQFDDGFKILYSKVASEPTYGDYSFYSVDDGTARSASISGDYNTKYYFRICHFTGTSCDTYSNVYSYTFMGPKSFPQRPAFLNPPDNNSNQPQTPPQNMPNPPQP